MLIVLIALLLFGGSRIASIGRGLGEGIRNFKAGLRDDDEPAVEPAEETLPASPADAPGPPVAAPATKRV